MLQDTPTPAPPEREAGGGRTLPARVAGSLVCGVLTRRCCFPPRSFTSTN